MGSVGEASVAGSKRGRVNKGGGMEFDKKKFRPLRKLRHVQTKEGGRERKRSGGLALNWSPLTTTLGRPWGRETRIPSGEGITLQVEREKHHLVKEEKVGGEMRVENPS